MRWRTLVTVPPDGRDSVGQRVVGWDVAVDSGERLAVVATDTDLEALSKEGPAGFRKIRQYERYVTVLICLVQASSAL